VKLDDTYAYYRVTSSAVIDVSVSNGIKFSGSLSKIVKGLLGTREL